MDPKDSKMGKTENFLVKKGEKNSRNDCWLEGGSSFKMAKLSRNHHVPHVMVTRESCWESQRLFFPCHVDLTLFAHY